MPTVDELSVQISALNRASGELTRVARDIQRLDRAAAKNSGMTQFNRQMDVGLRSAVSLGVGLAGVQAGAVVLQRAFRGTVGAAIAFESSFAGIRKTVDATESEFAQIADLNRRMARELPTSVNEINRIGEAAGQLGVRGVENLTKFERVMVDISNTTNLTSDVAATAFAQIANVLELPIGNVDRLGSAIVDLGNKSATTEADITNFVQRIAGAGKIAGLSAAQLAGVGAAFASTGVEAEAGGTAIQKVLISLRKAAVEGGAELEEFARVAGLSVQEFQNLAKSNAAEAFTRFVEGLGTAGDDAFAALERLGLTDQRLTRAFLSTAQAGDLLRRSIETGTTAFRENTALTIEAEKRYATTESQLRILQNTATDFGISLGQAVLPALNQSAEGASALIGAAEPLAPVLTTIAKAAPLAAAGLVAFSVASRAASFAQLQGDLAILTRAGFPNLAAQVRGNTSLMASLGAALKSPLGGFVALTGAMLALDVAARKLTGAGLIDNLTGAARAAKEAARFTDEYGNSLDRVAARIRAGLSQERAESLEVAQRIRDIQDATRALEELRRQERVKFDVAGGENIARATENIKKLKSELASLDLTLDELRPLRDKFADDPVIFGLLSDLIREQISLLGEEAGAVNGLASNWERYRQDQLSFQAAMRGEWIGGFERQRVVFNDISVLLGELTVRYDDLEDAVKRVNDAFSARTLDDINLDLAIAETEALISAYERAGLEIPANLQKWLDALIGNRDAVNELENVATLRFESMTRSLREFGGVGEEEITSLSEIFAAKILTLPDEVSVRLVAEAQQLLDTASEVERFINLVNNNRNLSIDLLLNIASQTLTPDQRLRQLGKGAADGGFVNKHGFIEVGEGNNPELILPLTKPRRMSELLKQAGLLKGSFAEGGFTVDDLMAGEQPTGTPPVGTVASARRSNAENGLAELAEELEAAGMSALEFIAHLELLEEVEAKAARVAEESNRAAIELAKLGIVLAAQGLTADAFLAQQGLRELHEAFLQSGLSAEQFRLRIVGISDQMQAAALEISRHSRSGIGIAASSGAEGIIVDGKRVTVGGTASVEGWKKVWDRIAQDFGAEAAKALQEQIIKSGAISQQSAGLEYVNALRKAQGKDPIGIEDFDPAKDLPRSPLTVNNYNAPVTVNAKGTYEETMNDLEKAMR